MFRKFLWSVIFIATIFIPGFSQSSNWLPTVDLNINPPFSTRLDIHVDHHGVHTIIHYQLILEYCMFNSIGEPIQETTISILDEYPRLSRITGYGDNLYIVYKEGNVIRTKKSTDGGTTWSNIDDIPFTNYTYSNGIDAVADENGLHVVYSEAQELFNYPYNTYYRYSDHNETNWINYHPVTGHPNDQGGFPAISLSTNRVHVTFADVQSETPEISTAGPAKVRERVNGVWQNSQEIFDGALLSYVIANSTELHGFYYDLVVLNPGIRADLYRENRSLGSTTWPQATLLLGSAEPGFAPVDGTVSADDKIHIVYGYELYREWDAVNGWSAPFAWAPHDYTEHARLSANGNDIYLIWNHYTALKMRHRDFPPNCPENITIGVGSGNHPQISWDAAKEVDISGCYIYKMDANMNYVLFDSVSAPQTSYIDVTETIQTGRGGPGYSAHYKVSATDLQANESVLSESVSILVEGEAPYLRIDYGETPKDFALIGNYPNPFNPSTTIRFALPVESMAKITVYDLGGREVAVIPEKSYAAGYHDVVFNASRLASGLYIYRLNAGKFVQHRKMMVLK